MQRSALREQKRERKEVRRLEKELKDLAEAQAIIQLAAAEMQNTVHREISGVVSKYLSAVFQNAYTFQIVFQKKRGKTEALLTFERNGVVIDDPKNSLGGGVIDITAFALRFVCILRSRPPLRRFVILDEPFKHVHLSARPLALKLLKVLAKETKTQFLISTHISVKTLKKAGFRPIVID